MDFLFLCKTCFTFGQNLNLYAMEIKTKFNLNDVVYPITRSGYNGFKRDLLEGSQFVFK